MSLHLFINGKKEEIEERMAIGRLLKARKIRPETVTVELNNKIIKKEDYGDTVLREGDRLELVYYMGGGARVKNG